ncbi:uncharacterized protein RJT20DRAFT_3644 [Scheffersomyces xylosifermentans]|uniref:uncharacterized protein n=1 Tax=Scheffersomyces xylosifermentans TaxID=1304137 RepID=UPI00315DE058
MNPSQSSSSQVSEAYTPSEHLSSSNAGNSEVSTPSNEGTSIPTNSATSSTIESLQFSSFSNTSLVSSSLSSRESFHLTASLSSDLSISITSNLESSQSNLHSSSASGPIALSTSSISDSTTTNPISSSSNSDLIWSSSVSSSSVTEEESSVTEEESSVTKEESSSLSELLSATSTTHSLGASSTNLSDHISFSKSSEGSIWSSAVAPSLASSVSISGPSSILPATSTITFQISAVAVPPQTFHDFVSLDDHTIIFAESQGPYFQLFLPGGYIKINGLFLHVDQGLGFYLDESPFEGWEFSDGSNPLAKREHDELLEAPNGQTEFYFCPNEISPIQLVSIAPDCVLGDLHILEFIGTTSTGADTGPSGVSGSGSAITSATISAGSSSELGSELGSESHSGTSVVSVSTSATSVTYSGTISTVLTTVITSSQVVTITECPSTITNCPAESIRTVTVPLTLTTTYCPKTQSSQKSSTLTYTSFETSVITKCPSCPLDYRSTTVIEHVLSSTYCPLTENSQSTDIGKIEGESGHLIKSATTEAAIGTRSTIVPPNNKAPLPSANGATTAITNIVTAKSIAKTIPLGFSTPIINSPENTVSRELLTRPVLSEAFTTAASVPIFESLQVTVAAESLAKETQIANGQSPTITPSFLLRSSAFTTSHSSDSSQTVSVSIHIENRAPKVVGSLLSSLLVAVIAYFV